MTAVLETPRAVAAAPTWTEPRLPTICQVLHSLDVGGAEVLAAEMARTLQRSFRFVFACLDEVGRLGHALADEGFPIHVLGRRPGIDMRCAARLAAVFRRERVDIIHAHQYTPWFQAAMARMLYRRPAILFTEHGRHYPDVRLTKHVLCNRVLFRKGDYAMGVGAAVRTALIRNEGLPEEAVGVVYNGVDLSPYGQNRETNRAEIRRELGLTDELVVMQVARLNYLKDHGTAIRAVERAVAQLPHLRLILVGEGEERDALESYVRERRLTHVVRFLGVRRDIPRLLAGADIFLLSSISEGIPLTIIEAMASELPVISTDVGGVREMIDSGKNGLLATARDDVQIAEHILRLAKSPEDRQAFGTHGKHRAREMFSQRRMNESYQYIYEELLRNTPRLA